jgi:hypothetical protein
MRTRSSVLAALLAAILAGGLLAGCGGGSGDGTATPGDSVSPSPGTGSSGPSGSPSLRPPSEPPSKYPSGEMTLTGKPEDGVEAGCIVMRSDGVLYLLIGGNQQVLKSGQTVMVKGRPNPGLLTTCQQGLPFQVSEVRPA